jgi:hypothetical protein
MSKRMGGLIFIAVNGEGLQAKGSFTYNIGAPKREAIVGSDKVHGYKELPQVPYIEGEITDHSSLQLSTLFATKDATVTLQLANGKTFVLEQAWYAGDGEASTEEGAIGVRFEGIRGREIAA